MSDQPAMYPYCPTCGGKGEITTDDFVPYGIGSTRMSWTEYCHACTEQGNCARCGKPMGKDDADIQDHLDNFLPCPHCGWNWGDGETDLQPGFYDEPNDPDLSDYPGSWWDILAE